MLHFITLRIEQMRLGVGVKLVYLPPYSPDLNPIEELLAELKAFIWRFGNQMKTTLGKYLIPCSGGVLIVGARENAEGHFDMTLSAYI